VKNIKRYSAFILSTGIMWSSQSLALPLTNGNFASGFAGWSGEVIIDPATTPTPATLTTPNYTLNTGGALLTTSFLTDGIYNVRLFQDFNIPTLTSPLNTLALNLSVGWTLSNPTGRNSDFASALLEDTGSPLLLDLTGGGTFDITSWAGKSVSLSFLVQDNAGIADTLQVGGIGITETVVNNNNTVPEPTGLMIFGISLLALRKKYLVNK